MTKEDFRIVQTDTNEFHIEKRIIDTHYTWWGKRKEVVRWMRCDSSGNPYGWRVRGNTYWCPAPQKPFISLENAEWHIERIIYRSNNYPKIYELS